LILALMAATVLVFVAVRMGASVALFLIPALIAAAVLVFVAVRVVRGLRRKAARAGYTSIGDYLRAVPRSDQEQREAVDLAVQGLALCVVGLIVPPLILVGVFPLYYGTRKILYAQMGLALADDGDRPGA
jgi:hypothetical protein